ncbi:MAG: CapA family protein [Ruminococcaceae bacterium]|nr:CapA family protein [Oscillospiraceae bacterium]
MKNKLFALIICICVLFTCCSCQNVEVTTAERTTNGADLPIEPITAPETYVEEPSEVRISFLAVGDNIPHDSVINTAKNDATGNEKYNFSEIYKGIASDVNAADIAFVNQESPVGGEALGISGYPNFNAPHEMIDELISVGFDVFNIANNHMLDKGEKGYRNTVDYFNSLPITMIGGYTKSDYNNVRIVESKGVKIAFLSYTTLVNSGHANDISSGSEYIIPYANTADITRQVGIAKEQADVVIVSMHWGNENKFTIASEQTKYAKLCADLGVDAVIGHHSHVPGKVEWVSGESGNKTLVAYSLGNFCSSQLYAKNMIGEMLKFDIVKDVDGTISIENAYVDPVVCHYKTDTSRKDNQDLHVRYEVRMYMLKDYTEEMSNSHGSQNWGRFSFANLKAYITDVVSSEFLK